MRHWLPQLVLERRRCSSLVLSQDTASKARTVGPGQRRSSKLQHLQDLENASHVPQRLLAKPIQTFTHGVFLQPFLAQGGQQPRPALGSPAAHPPQGCVWHDSKYTSNLNLGKPFNEKESISVLVVL
eukprot:1734852-Amphidinium_carterae.1